MFEAVSNTTDGSEAAFVKPHTCREDPRLTKGACKNAYEVHEALLDMAIAIVGAQEISICSPRPIEVIHRYLAIVRIDALDLKADTDAKLAKDFRRGEVQSQRRRLIAREMNWRLPRRGSQMRTSASYVSYVFLDILLVFVRCSQFGENGL